MDEDKFAAQRAKWLQNVAGGFDAFDNAVSRLNEPSAEKIMREAQEFNEKMRVVIGICIMVGILSAFMIWALK